MFYIHARGYISAYKLMSNMKTISGLDIDLFTHIFVEMIYNMVRYFNMHRCALDFDSLFLGLIEKENK